MRTAATAIICITVYQKVRFFKYIFHYLLSSRNGDGLEHSVTCSVDWQ